MDYIYVLYTEKKIRGKIPYLSYERGKWREDYTSLSLKDLRKISKGKTEKFGYPVLKIELGEFIKLLKKRGKI